jgi:hypothetical protein
MKGQESLSPRKENLTEEAILGACGRRALADRLGEDVSLRKDGTAPFD